MVNFNKQKAAVISSSSPIEEKNRALSEINYNISELEKEIADQTVVLTNKSNVCNTIKSKLDDIASTLRLENVLTNDQLVELSSFISEGSFEDDSITITSRMTYTEKIEQSQALYDKATQLLSKISTPNIEFEIDIDGFVFNKNFQHLTKEINTGCIIGVFNSDDEFCEYVLLKISIDYSNQSVKMTFGNRFKSRDNLFDDLYDIPAKTSNTVSYIKDIFDFNKANSELKSNEEFRNSSLDLSRQAIISSNNQDILLDDTGLHGRKFDPTTKDFMKEQVWLVNNALVFTDDGFNTIKTAIGKIPVDYDVNGDGNIDEQDYVYGLNADAIIAGCINAGLIKAGKLESQDGSCYFDLDNNKILANRLGSEHYYARIGNITHNWVGLELVDKDKLFFQICETDDDGFSLIDGAATQRFNASNIYTSIFDGRSFGIFHANAERVKIQSSPNSPYLRLDDTEGTIWCGGNAIGVDSTGVFKVVNGMTSYL